MLTAFAMLGLVATLAVGCALVIASRRGLKRHPSCGKCRYDVTGSIGTVDRCPECGAAFAEVGILPPGRGQRSLTLGAVGVVLIIIAVGCIGTSMLSLLYGQARQRQAVARQRAAVAERAAAIETLQRMEAQAADQAETASAPDSDPAPAQSDP